MNIITAPLLELPEIRAAAETIKQHKKGLQVVAGCIDAGKAGLVHALSKGESSVLVISENEMTAKTLYEDICFYEPDALFYPAKDLLFYQADVASNHLYRRRMEVFRALSERKRVVVVAPVSAVMDEVTARGALKDELLLVEKGEECVLRDAAKTLEEFGYERCGEVSEPGLFSIRGDILDVWGMTWESPARIEFFGDDVDSIRSFDPATQRRTDELFEVTIYPVHDNVGKKEPFLKWFSPETSCVFIDEPNRVFEAALATEKEFTESVENRTFRLGDDEGELPDIIGAERLKGDIMKYAATALSSFETGRDGRDIREVFRTNMQSVGSYSHSVKMLLDDLMKYRRQKYRVLVLAETPSKARHLTESLKNSDIPCFYTEDRETPLKPGQIAVTAGFASRGVEYPDIRFAILSDADLFGSARKKNQARRKKKHEGEVLGSLADLSVGDAVVHENHGIGEYRGIEQVTVDGVSKDYIKLAYDDGNLFIPATQLDLLQKYSGGEEGKKIKLARLNTGEWQKTRTRVKGALRDMARELISLYALRENRKGFASGPDTEWQREFEESFPYEETEDQLQAIEDVKRDMESDRIMDRLICGDVGYGKTEIALRAAFKAVQESKQVVYLVPTTILAQQHYNTFTGRLAGYPVRVDLICRFRTPAEIKKSLSDLKAGLVDIVIGTHRLLSKDVKYKDLGLLIIDEEQRFGVAHKEKIKQMRQQVEVLTLSATPIPRTLHMSLVGIRSMSVLLEPPRERVPVQTFVCEFHPELVREAICRELARGGQVYYVYNRVRDISETAAKIKALVPEAVVGTADGQMDRNSLEDVMVEFINGRIDVLVTTTIIETGLDIANANTIIIQDADRFGLAQLYQLRGRVGRTNRTAYAFLMYRKDKTLKEVAEKRLRAIREFTELGSGIKIAMRDLEIRGAGNLLGAEQSGHMADVGYDLYCKLLRQAVKLEMGEAEEEEFETTVDIPIDAYIPDSYITDGFLKLDFYKKIAAVSDEESKEDLSDEMTDRFGEMPVPCRNLIAVAMLKGLAHTAGFTEIKAQPREVQFIMGDRPNIDFSLLPQVIGSFAGAFRVRKTKDGEMIVYVGGKKGRELADELTLFIKKIMPGEVKG